MIKTTYKQIRNPQFLGTFAKIGQHTKFKHTNAAYHVAKLYKAMTEEIRTAQDIFQNLVKEYALLDEAGNIVPQKDMPDSYTIPTERHEAWKAALKDFNDKEITIDQKPILYGNIVDINLSPVEMLAVEDVVKFEGA